MLKNTVKFRGSPQEVLEVRVDGNRVMPATTGRRNKPTRYTVIGFDSEYQVPHVAIEQLTEAIDEVKKNRLLSYQFETRVVDADDSVASLRNAGIIVAEDGARITLGEFVVAALGSFLEAHGTETLPADIYLVGHFTKADLPMFDDFAGSAREWLGNVRNTFVTLGTPRILKLHCADTGDKLVDLKLTVRDTILLAPDSAKSLADVGDMLGFEKIRLAETPAKERAIKGQMQALMERDWPLFQRYAIRDAEICAEYAEKIIRQSQRLLGKFEMPIALTQFGTKMVLDDWQARGWSRHQVLGREEVRGSIYVKALGYSKDTVEHPFVEDVFHELDFVTATYHGGRNEQFMVGICDEDLWRDHDLSSAYPTPMALIGKPDWASIEREVPIEAIRPFDLAFGSVDFEFPPEVLFPTLPVRTSSSIIFPRKGRSYCAAPEIALAKALGAKLMLRRAIRVPMDPSQLVFAPFIKRCIEARKSATTKFDNLFWKQVGNSTYGKTAQGLRKKRVYNLQDDDMMDMPESKLTQPFFASFITSYARAVLGEILNRFPAHVNVFSVTTDGFLSNANDEEIAWATSGTMFQSFRETRYRLKPDDKPIEIKHTILQPLGWRTRGAATLKPGPGESANIVLQKGGIKSGADLSEVEENARVVKLFFNRTINDNPQRYTSGIGIRDLMNYGTDFVFRSVTKRLSMEFDWKRRPKNPGDRVVEFEGRTYTHVSFDTEPLEDIAEFQRIRDVWQRYDTKPRKVIKTAADLRQFLHYVQTNKVLSPKSQSYLRKQDGAIKRLRADLCRAFRHHKAGFDLILPRYGGITHLQFSGILEEVGISCKVTDVENARADFEPHRTPAEPEVVAALNRLKDQHFPELDIDQFFDPHIPR